MENNQQLSPETSLKVIYEMIESVKSRIGKSYFYYLFWGYLVAATCLLEYYLMSVANYHRHYLVWPVLMGAGTLVTIIFSFFYYKSEPAKTYIGTTMKFFWIGWFVSLVLLLAGINLRQSFDIIVPVILAMYGLAIFVTGGIVNFKPLLYAAILAWAGSVIALFANQPAQLLILAVVVIVAFIIPGHILRKLSKTE